MSNDALQLEIAGLKHEVAELRVIVNAFLNLVDPDEVRAAIELYKQTPPSEVLREWAKNCEPPADLWEAEEERPW